MKKKIGKRALALLGASILSFSCLSACSGGKGGEEEPVLKDGALTVKVLPTTQKVMLDEDIAPLSSGAVTIEGAKGEKDSGQFVVRCDEDVRNYDVTISDFKNGEATISKDNVEICKQVYTYCSDTVRYGGVLKAGYYPDALIPLKYIQDFEEDTIKKGENQGIWLDVNIPKEAKAGVYTAEVTFSYNESGSVTVPVQLTVYDFEIYETPRFKSSFSLRNNFDRPQDYWLAISELDGTNETVTKYFEKLLDYNVSCSSLLDDTPEMFVESVRKYYDKLTNFRIPYRAVSNTQNDKKYMKERMCALFEACLEDGVNYYEKAYYRLDMFYDEYQDVPWREPLVEPTILECEAVEKEIAETYRSSELVTDENREFAEEVLATIGSLRHHMTSWWDEKYGEYLNLCCPLYPKFQYSISLDEAQALRESNDVEWWSYGCIMSDTYPAATWEIDDYAVSSRDLLWFNYENDIVGNILWSAAGNCNWAKSNSDFNVWTLVSDFYTVASREGMTNGDGYVLYPGAPYGSEEPFGSVRLSIYRDGVDDHTYMCQLEDEYKSMDIYGGEYAVTNAKGLVSFLNKQMLGRNSSKLDYDAVYAAKRALAASIELAQKENFVIETLDADMNEITYSFYAESGDTVTLNGTTLTGTASGNGLHYAGKLTIPEDCSVILKVNDKEVALTSVPQATVLNDFNGDTFDSTSLYFVNKTTYTEKDEGALNTEGQYAMSGNSARVRLNGRGEEDVDVTTYKSKFAFQLGKYDLKLENCWSLEFYVYNASEKDIEAIVYLEGEDEEGVTHEAEYDVILLKAGEWKKVVVDNLNVVTTNTKEWNYYGQKLGLKIGNPVNGDGSLSYVDLYVDNLIMRAR